MIRIFFIFTLVLTLLSCNTSMEKKLKAHLEEKYQEEFHIIRDEFSAVRGNYGFQAYPLKNPNIVFRGYHDEGFQQFMDEYDRAVFSYKFNRYINDHWKAKFGTAYIYASVVLSDERYTEEVWAQSEVSTAMLINEPYVSVKIFADIIGEVNAENQTQMLGDLQQLLEKFKDHPKASFWIDFKFLKATTPKEVVDRGLINKTVEVEESLVQQRLNIIFKSNKPVSDFNVDTLLNLVREVSPGTYAKTNKRLSLNQ